MFVNGLVVGLMIFVTPVSFIVALAWRRKRKSAADTEGKSNV
jgi:hypothetical protein